MKRIAGLVISTLFLAACGGGGGGGGSTPPATPPIQTQSVQRAIAAQSLATIESAQIAYEYLPIYTVSPEPAVSRRGIHTAALQAVAGWHGLTTSSQRHIAAAPATPYSACYDGVESTLVEVSSTEVDEYEQEFYDTACTTLYANIFYDIIATSSSSIGATGTATYYSRSNVIDDYQALTVTETGIDLSSGTFTFEASDAPSSSATVTDAIALSCSTTATYTESCGAADVLRESAANLDVGSTLTFNAAAPVFGSSATTVAFSGATAGVSGAYSTLTIAQGTFPAWVINSGKQVDATAFTSSLQFDSSAGLIGTSLNFTDTTDNATVSVTSTGATAVITGIVKQTSTGTTAATFTTDTSGNGTITFENGQTATITNWRIVD